jgi:hypothetical protein
MAGRGSFSHFNIGDADPLPMDARETRAHLVAIAAFGYFGLSVATARQARRGQSLINPRCPCPRCVPDTDRDRRYRIRDPRREAAAHHAG